MALLAAGTPSRSDAESKEQSGDHITALDSQKDIGKGRQNRQEVNLKRTLTSEQAAGQLRASRLRFFGVCRSNRIRKFKLGINDLKTMSLHGNAREKRKTKRPIFSPPRSLRQLRQIQTGRKNRSP